MSDSSQKKSMQAVVRRPQRWDEPLSDDMTRARVVSVLDSIHFRQMEASNFVPQISLEDLVRNDCRIHVFDTHDSIVRSGAYLNSMYIVLSGRAHIFTEQSAEKPANKGRNLTTTKPSVGSSFLQWLRNPKISEVRYTVDALTQNADLKQLPAARSKTESRVQVHKVPDDARELAAGDVFGESAVLGRNEMKQSVVAKSSCVVLEIRWQGLNELRKREPNFRQYVDTQYRQRGLYEYLRSVPLFESLPNSDIRELAGLALFEIHGEFEWHKEFKKAGKKMRESQNYDEVIENEVLIAREGDYLDGLLLVRNGFARLSRKINHGHYTLGHLSSGDFFGLQELRQSSQRTGDVVLNCSLRALGYTDVIRIPTDWFEEKILKNNDDRLQELLSAQLEMNTSLSAENEIDTSASINQVDRKFTEFVVEHHFVNGTEAMVIDLERCVRCDDCVTACANAHNNNPRFNRHGPKSGRYMIANACMHCEDPVCMIGCPTGAIHRAEDGVVSINDSTCIGCSTCANSCPYDNIRMVSVRDQQGQLLVDNNSKAILKATKCDLCSTVAGGPACERACSHDALVRMDLKDTVKLAEWLNR